MAEIGVLTDTCPALTHCHPHRWDLGRSGKKVNGNVILSNNLHKTYLKYE